MTMKQWGWLPGNEADEENPEVRDITDQEDDARGYVALDPVGRVLFCREVTMWREVPS